MPPRASAKKGAASAKRGPRGKKATPISQPEIVENRASELEAQLGAVEETKLADIVQNSAEEEKKEVSQEERLLEAEVQQVEEVLPTAHEDKAITTGESWLNAVLVEDEPSVIEGVVEEKIPEVVSGDSLILNASNVKEEGDDMQGKEEAEERNDGDEENGAAHMDLDKDTQKESDEGAKHDVVKKETSSAEVEDKGSNEVEDSKGGGDAEDVIEGEVDDSKVCGEVENTERGGDGANNVDASGTVNKDEEADKSGSDEEDNEEEEDPSVYMEAPLTDRKKEKEFEIFVGGLDKEAVEEDLIKIFGEFGEIQSARIVKHQTTHKSKGFAFIRYVTAEQAKKVLFELKDGIEVRGKRVGISPSQDNDTLYMGNISKTWTKEQVLETLKSFGIEQIEEIYLPDDPKNEGKRKGFALLEFNTHSDAMAAFQRLRKPDAIFGCDRSAKVAFAQSSIHPSEEALSQVKTVFVEGLTDSWDEEKVKELCKQYGEIEKVQLSRNLGKKRKDFGFVTFTSRESAVACVEGINNAQIVEGDVKVKANLAKPQNKGRLAKQGARGGFKVEEGEKTEETGPSKMKGHAKSKGGGGKGKKTLPKLKNSKGGKPHKTQGSVARGQGSGVQSRSEKTNQQRNRQPPKGEKHGGRDMDTGYNGRSSKKARGNMHGRPPNNRFGSQRSRSHSGKPRPNYVAASTTYGNTYAQGYAASSSRYQGHMYGTASGSKRPYSDMEPHAGYLEPAANKQSRDAYSYGPRRPVGYDVQGSSGAAFGGGNAAFGGVAPGSVVPTYVPNYASYGGYQGEAVETIPDFVRECGASLVVTDFSPLRQVRKWKEEMCKRVDDSVAVHEVDAHNVVPIWVASQKLEYSAKTIRSKIHKLLPEYLVDFPTLQSPTRKWVSANQVVDWEDLIADVLRKGAEVPELEWCVSGEDAALEVLLGSKNGFLTTRLKNYATDRNIPLKPKGLSGLSPYLHFGQISAQRCALEARTFRKLHPQSVDAFLEELIVRRELADNYCYYQPQYDSLEGAWQWARNTLAEHAADKREHVYTKEQLEMAKTADPLWNASQLEMVHHGKMHGFMRMYWAKKILEWTTGPAEALSVAIYLNDKYEIDGRDPSGYVGCMWSICGVHDQGWKERPIFGKIRYMNYAGCKRKFDVDGYIAYVKKLVGETKKRKAESLASIPAAKEPRSSKLES